LFARRKRGRNGQGKKGGEGPKTKKNAGKKQGGPAEKKTVESD